MTLEELRWVQNATEMEHANHGDVARVTREPVRNI